ncbi:MAG: penicillin-binding protein activator [Alphaproteobacteria bacterium]|nr:penicillin-binding protein activator [Alphaproteobacteria bacterium]
MYINNKIIISVSLCALISGCGTNINKFGSQDYESIATTQPTKISDVLSKSGVYGKLGGGKVENIAVLLPTSGDNKTLGQSIKSSIETAVIQQSFPNISVSFYDLSGDEDNKQAVITDMLSTNPDIVIGPIFADDTKLLRDIKSTELPVLSFTSDITAIGDGVMTMALMPTQSIEAIIQQIKKDNKNKTVIIAPNTQSGKQMASITEQTLSAYNIDLIGLFYYESMNSDSMKDIALQASMYNTRQQANTKAKEILSNIILTEHITSNDKHILEKQLDALSKTEVLGDLPFDSVLFLGNADDSKTVASFLRYYGVNNKKISFYGTTLWQGTDIVSDLSMSGAKFTSLPELSEQFIQTYKSIENTEPNYLSAFSYDAANLAMGMTFSETTKEKYLLDANGYIGSNGIFRLLPYGQSERGLRIMQINGSGTPNLISDTPTTFINTLYNIETVEPDEVSPIDLITDGINPLDYIVIPNNLRNKYKTKTIGVNNYQKINEEYMKSAPIQISDENAGEIINNPEYTSVKRESISKKNIDSIEIITD